MLKRYDDLLIDKDEIRAVAPSAEGTQILFRDGAKLEIPRVRAAAVMVALGYLPSATEASTDTSKAPITSS